MGAAELLVVTRYQRGIQASVLLHLVCVGLFGLARTVQTTEFLVLAALGLVVTWIAGVAFVFLLARRLYSNRTALMLSALAVTPIAGLLALLFVYSNANTLLRMSGVEVRFLGAEFAANVE